MTATVKGIFSAKRILRDFNPDVVIGVGGYASFPMVCAAILGGYPRIDHGAERHSRARQPRARRAGWILPRSPIRAPSIYFGSRAVVTGNPIRPQFKSIPAKAHQPPFTVLIFGGSQGAQSINKAVRDSLDFLADWKGKLRFVHQTGRAAAGRNRARRMPTAGFEADVRAFFNDFHAAIRRCRI